MSARWHRWIRRRLRFWWHWYLFVEDEQTSTVDLAQSVKGVVAGLDLHIRSEMESSLKVQRQAVVCG